MITLINSGEVNVVNYGRYRLKYNPFPMTAITAGGTPFPFYAPKAEEKVKDFVTRTYEENQFGGMLIVGDYGFGKTYTLRWLEKEINERYSQRNSVAACGIYVENPLSSPRELISAIVSHYGTHKYLTMLWALVARAFRERYEKEGNKFLGEFRIRQMGLYDKDLILELFYEARIMDPMRLLRRLCDDLSKMRQFNLKAFSRFAYDSTISRLFGDNEMAHSLSEFNEDGFNASIREWAKLIEYKVVKSSVHVGYSDSDYMRSILSVFRERGYRRVYLLVDEFEDIHENLRKEKLTAYLRTLRDCIDANQSMLAIVLALKPAIVDRIQSIYSGFLHRFPFSYRIDLAGVMKGAISDFILDILRSAREEGFDSMGIHPFTADGLGKIYEFTGPNPRLILQVCSDMLYELAKKNGEKIDKDFIQEYYATGEPSAALGMDEVWITTRVKARMEEEKKE